MNKLGKTKVLSLVASVIIIGSLLLVYHTTGTFDGDGPDRGPYLMANTSSTSVSLSDINYSHLSFSKSFAIPKNNSIAYPKLEIRNSMYNHSEAVSFLRSHNFIEGNSSNIKNRSHFIISFKNNTSAVSLNLNGYLEFQENDIDYILNTREEIKKNSTLLGRSEALVKAVAFLRAHNFSLSSWDLLFNLTLYEDHISQNKTYVVYYTFKWLPVVNNITVLVTNGPYMIMKINPLGEVESLSINLKDIKNGNGTTRPRWDNPALALMYFDTQVNKSLTQDALNVESMRLCYHVNEKTSEIVPTWVVFCGYMGLSIYYLD